MNYFKVSVRGNAEQAAQTLMFPFREDERTSVRAAHHCALAAVRETGGKLAVWRTPKYPGSWSELPTVTGNSGPRSALGGR